MQQDNIQEFWERLFKFLKGNLIEYEAVADEVNQPPMQFIKLHACHNGMYSYWSGFYNYWSGYRGDWSEGFPVVDDATSESVTKIHI